MKAKICYTVKEEEILPEASKFLMSLHVSIDSLKEDSYSNVASIAMKIDIMRRNLIKIDEKMEDSYDILLGYINFLKKLREDKQEGEKDEQKHEEG